jgi:hypothetical protein
MVVWELTKSELSFSKFENRLPIVMLSPLIFDGLLSSFHCVNTSALAKVFQNPKFYFTSHNKGYGI